MNIWKMPRVGNPMMILFFSEFNHLVMHEIEDDYSSEELLTDSDHSDDSGSETVIPKYKLYRKEQMCKEFKFKLGMEFTSLDLFKEAIL